jgi:hypothetical protein
MNRKLKKFKNWLRFTKNGLESPHLDQQFPTLRIELFGCFETSALAEAHTWAAPIYFTEHISVVTRLAHHTKLVGSILVAIALICLLIVLLGRVRRSG